MYEVGDPLGDLSVPPGTNLLVSGPPMTGKRALAFRVLANGVEREEGAIVVSTKDNATRVRSAFHEHAPDATLGIVDCVTRQQGMAAEDEDLTRYASSPNDLTGIGIELSELLQEFYQDRGHERNRVLLYSLSTLLMYSNLQTVFRFLHVFTGRVQSVDGLGLFVIDATAHDDQTMNTLKQLFDGIVEVQEVDDERRCRVTGMGAGTTDWTPF
ncbi:MAG: RAD55 family ATPase [Halobacteriaceae archaeon]